MNAGDKIAERGAIGPEAAILRGRRPGRPHFTRTVTANTGVTLMDLQMPETRLIRVLSVDDYPLLREGIAALIASQQDMGWTRWARFAPSSPKPALSS
jgi:hypothetical protein